ncbi:MAG: hypothetical protein U0R17_01385 [Acidimicrobiia bacterium]
MEDQDNVLSVVEYEGNDPIILLEKELRRLPDIQAARIVAGYDGEPSEVHIVASPNKTPKQLVRDIQSVAIASFGFDIDRRRISIVQIDAPETDFILDREFRPRIMSITSESTGLRSTVKVSLEYNDTQALGFAEGSVASAARHRLIAQATLDALRQLEPLAESLDVDAAQVVRIGGADVAVTTVIFVIPPDEQVVSGSAIVRQTNEADAIARAVLDATNRRLHMLVNKQI